MSDTSSPLFSSVCRQVYGIGAEKLVERWIAIEILLRKQKDPRADLVAAMRRQMQEATGLVVDPSKITRDSG